MSGEVPPPEEQVHCGNRHVSVQVVSSRTLKIPPGWASPLEQGWTPSPDVKDNCLRWSWAKREKKIILQHSEDRVHGSPTPKLGRAKWMRPNRNYVAPNQKKKSQPTKKCL